MNRFQDDQTASRRRSLLQRLAGRLLRLLGWEVQPFPNLPKAIAVGGPHTSNWDGIIGLLGATALALPTRFMIKHTLFKGPLGWLLKRLGAIPVDRTRSGGMVSQTVAELARHERIIIVMTPEGTRSGAEQWKTGFHHIARLSGVPIVLATADYGKRQISYPLVVQASDDLEGDLRSMYDCFAAVTPRHPEKLSKPVRRLWEQRVHTDQRP
ncbi:MAG: 1-acyl-sn-glycerol-3-phosphate acyltransferase [Saccharospirillum sp.]